MDKSADKISSILVVRFGQIGDLILTLPLVEALAETFPRARIDFVVKAEFASLVDHHPAINRVWAFERSSGFAGLRALIADLDRQNYDLLIDLHSNLRSVLLRLLGNARMKRSYRKFTLERRLLKLARWNLLRTAPPVCERYFTAMEDFGLHRNGLQPRLHLGEEVVDRARALMAERGLQWGRYLVLAPGASYPTKQWPPERFARAAAELDERAGGIVILGGKADRETAARIGRELAALGREAVDLTGSLALADSAAVIGGARLVLSNDSGLMHVADGQDRPLVAVFGPTSRELGFFPQGPRATVAEITNLDCRPCSLHGDEKCPRDHHRCMIDLSPAAVVAAAHAVLAREDA